MKNKEDNYKMDYTPKSESSPDHSRTYNTIRTGVYAILAAAALAGSACNKQTVYIDGVTRQEKPCSGIQTQHVCKHKEHGRHQTRVIKKTVEWTVEDAHAPCGLTDSNGDPQ